MAGLILGDISGAVVDFFKEVADYIKEAVKWIKQAILKLYDIVRSGIKEAVAYEKDVVKEAIRSLGRNDSLLFGVAFAILFDTLGVNG